MPGRNARRHDTSADEGFMRRALTLARRGYGRTSPNPMVGAVIVRGGRIVAEGWHRRAGEPHAEIEAITAARKRKLSVGGATLYVTLEPCCTEGRTPPCTEAIIRAGITRAVVAAIDPNPKHCGRGLLALHRAGMAVDDGLLAEEATELNEAFNHWVVRRTPFVTVKAAMTLDGKIATASGASKWITGPKARSRGMRLRQRVDAILVGVNTVLRDDPRLTFRPESRPRAAKRLRRIILDSFASIPLESRVVSDEHANNTIIVISPNAPEPRVAALERRVTVWRSPGKQRGIKLPWLLRKLGRENVTDLLVEGGGEVNASFLLGGLAQRVAFFYAPKILGGRSAIKAVGGEGLLHPAEWLRLKNIEWQALGPDLFMTARLAGSI